MGASVLARVSAIDRAIPARVITALQAEIIAAQAKRSTRRDGRTNWYELSAAPRTLFEQVIGQLRRNVPDADEYVGAEWWCRATTTDTGFPFHFDRDEGVRNAIVSPALASILYVSNAGGPTLVLDATPTRATAPRAGIAFHPRAGRFGMFPGALLHGVLPGPPSRRPRVTMLINWWRTVPRMERAPRLRSPAGLRWPGDTRPLAVELEAFDPSRVLAKAAWRALIADQHTYR